MLINCIDLLFTVESTYKGGITTDISNTNKPSIHFFNERNQNRKLAKISRNARAHRSDCQLRVSDGAFSSFANPVSLSLMCLY